MTFRLSLVVLTTVIAVAPALAQVSFSERTGRDVADYAPHLPVDFLHLRLDLDFEDLTSQSFDGESTLRLRARHEMVQTLQLDAVDMEIAEVSATVVGAAEGEIRSLPVSYDYDGARIALRFDRPLPPDADVEVTIRYAVDSPVDGMYWALPDEDYPDRPLAIHTQGETEMSRFWYPCVDYPNDRASVETIVTVPEGYTVIANGGLVDQTSRNGRTTFHHKQARPHVFYLNSLVIGKFDQVENEWRGRPVDYYVPPGRGHDAERTFGDTLEMLDYFSELLDEEYPYEKYSQVNVPLFDFGGMENTSATTLHDRAILDERAAIDQSLERLIAHELAHQWFGDLITCHGWKHIWLNEGFATFFASMWREHDDGREDYLYAFYTRMQGVCEVDKTTNQRGIFFPDYLFTFDPFFHSGGLPYSKGSCVLQMLRRKLGETLFWRGIQVYVDQYRETQVETDDFRRVMESVAGQSLDQFFDQWIYRPGTPELAVSYEWDDDQQMVTLEFRQEQHIDRRTPAFVLDLDLVWEVDGQLRREVVAMEDRTLTIQRSFDHKPTMVCLDPDLGLTMSMTAEKPRKMWLRQLRAGPTNIARIVAARHLGQQPRDDVKDALVEVIEDLDEHWSVRDQAAQALGEHQTVRAKRALLSIAKEAKTVADPRVRLAVVKSLAKYDYADVGETLAKFARQDASYAVEAAATAAFGKIQSYDAHDLLHDNLEKESYNDMIRIAAIQALVDRKDPTAEEAARRFAAYGNHFRLRPDAIRALGRLGKKMKDRRADIHESLVGWLNDSQPRSVRAAISALGDLGGKDSIEALEEFARREGPERSQALATQTVERLRSSSSDRALQEQLDELRKKLDELSEQVDKAGS